MKKVICDVCLNEIDQYNSFGLFGIVKKRTGLDLDPLMQGKEPFEKIDNDLCEDCATEIEAFVNTLQDKKKEKKNKKS